MIRQRCELVGALVAKYLATVAAVVLPQAVGELVVAALTVGDIEVGNPLRCFVVRLVNLVPAATTHGVIAEGIAIVLVVFQVARLSSVAVAKKHFVVLGVVMPHSIGS